MLGKSIFEGNIFTHSRADMGCIGLQTQRATIHATAFASFRKFAQITPDHIHRHVPFSGQIRRKDASVALQTSTNLAQAFVFEDGICSGRA
ncbi:hypothetical protein GCM10007868_16220 [Gluconobacter frateurii]|nr:hypothetical protein GCM10007868_16220 [Gluconobacter frateurii]